MSHISKADAQEKIKKLDFEIEQIEDRISATRSQSDKNVLQEVVDTLRAEKEWYLEFI